MLPSGYCWYRKGEQVSICQGETEVPRVLLAAEPVSWKQHCRHRSAGASGSRRPWREAASKAASAPPGLRLPCYAQEHFLVGEEESETVSVERGLTQRSDTTLPSPRDRDRRQAFSPRTRFSHHPALESPRTAWLSPGRLPQKPRPPRTNPPPIASPAPTRPALN